MRGGERKGALSRVGPTDPIGAATPPHGSLVRHELRLRPCGRAEGRRGNPFTVVLKLERQDDLILALVCGLSRWVG